MMPPSLQDLRTAYVQARTEAEAARDQWDAFLAIEPITDREVPSMTGNIERAYEVLVEAEAEEAKARDALWAVLRPGGLA